MSSFKCFRKFVTSLPVVNDAAERNIKLIQDFIACSHDEKLRQDLLLAIEHKRKSEHNKRSKMIAKKQKTT